MQIENDLSNMTKQLDELKSQRHDAQIAESSADQLSKQIDELTRKLKTEQETVVKLRKSQQELKKVGAVFSFALYLHENYCSWYASTIPIRCKYLIEHN